jgi:hypothetical protein
MKMKVGDLVRFTGGEQLYFHFPSEEWFTTKIGAIGIISQVGPWFGAGDTMYYVCSIEGNRACWFYEDELEIVSEAK